MKERNILKRFGNGWILGLTDDNELRLQAPTGEVGWLIEHGRRQLLSGDVDFDEGAAERNYSEKAIEVPAQVVHHYHIAQDRLMDVHDKEIEEAQIDAIVEDVTGASTLEEMGFDDNPRVDGSI